jgi:hypothetical protein
LAYVLCFILQYLTLWSCGRFEVNTHAIGKAIGLGATIDYLSNIGMNQIHAYEVTTYIFGGYVYVWCFSIMIYFSKSLFVEYSSVFHSPYLTVIININNSMQEPWNPSNGYNKLSKPLLVEYVIGYNHSILWFFSVVVNGKWFQ